MATRRTWIITCDEPGCWDEYATTFSNLNDAIGKAEGDHWRHIKRGRLVLIYCPEHKAAHGL